MSENSHSQSANLLARDRSLGLRLAILGFLVWGAFPIYFNWLQDISATEILAHRVIWSVVLLVIIDLYRKPEIRWYTLLSNKKVLITSSFASFFLSMNWVFFIWAVGNGMAMEASLGYFLNPLVNVFLGMVFFGERLHKWQVVAIAFAVVGVSYLVWITGSLPWITVILALSFAGYGFIRKKYPLDGATSLTFETFLILPFAVLYLCYLQMQGQMSFLHLDWRFDIGLLFAGAVTTAPLLLYLTALPKLPLSTMGLLQYLVPTMQFLIAVFVFHEAFDLNRFIAFSFIWTGLIIYSSSELGKQHKRRQLAKRQVADKAY